MAEHGIATMVHYASPIHRHDAYSHLAGALPLGVSERLCDRVVSLPAYPELEPAEIEAVISAARESGA